MEKKKKSAKRSPKGPQLPHPKTTTVPLKVKVPLVCAAMALQFILSCSHPAAGIAFAVVAITGICAVCDIPLPTWLKWK